MGDFQVVCQKIIGWIKGRKIRRDPMKKFVINEFRNMVMGIMTQTVYYGKISKFGQILHELKMFHTE